MSGPHLVYFADPMCSWCYGFSPVIAEITGRFGAALPVRLVLGGLRPGTMEPMDAAARAKTREHWEHVHEASGQPFDYAFFDRPRFVYDTEPACRAVVAMRRHGPEAALAALRRIHAAFYAENRDVTDIETLAAIAVELGEDEAAFRVAFASDAVVQETWADFALSQRTGIAGFPTLIAGTGADDAYAMVTNGFQRGDLIVPALAAWLDRLAAA